MTEDFSTSIRFQIRRLYQALSPDEERSQLLSIGTQAGILTVEEGKHIGNDPTRLDSEQQYRIWEWIHRWEASHRRDWQIERDRVEAHSND